MSAINESPLNDIKVGLITKSWAEAHNMACEYVQEIDSTNNLAKEEAFEELDSIQLYLTDFQTQGRGRGNHTWTSPVKGSSLLSSWSFAVTQAPTPFVTSLIGLGLYHAARATWPFLNWNLKAPNDLHIGSKKIAGLLVETVSQGSQHRLIVGLGFNVFAHPSAIKESTNLFKELQAFKSDNDEVFPLLGEDWIRFIDRLLFEMCLVIPEAHVPPELTTQQALLSVFNSHPNLTTPFKNFNDLKEELWR